MDRENGKHPAGGTPKKSRPKKPKKPSRLTRQQKLLIAVAVVLAIVLIAVVACQSLFVRPDLPEKNADADSGTQEEEIDWGEGTRPRSDGERKSQDYYTVLILGRDTGGGGNTDTMLLASYDVTNQKATVMSIPRDTMVNVSWDIKRINSVYNYYGGGDRGIQYLYKEIAQLVGIEPDYQVVVEWDAVGQIVDAMGGVWFDVPRNMNYDDPYQDLHIHQEKGYRLLTGDDAMQVLRYRHDNDMRYGYPDGDLGRIKTQQAFLTAMVDQLLQIKNVTKINQFIQVFQNNVETDLSFQNILWFAQQAILGGLSMENVEFVTMPNRTASCWSRTYHNYQSYVVPSANELLELVNNELSPFKEVFTLSDLDIMYVNSDGSIGSTTGHVEDSKAAKPPVKNSGSSTTTTTPDPDTETVTDPNGTVTTPDTGETGSETGNQGSTGTGEQTGGETGSQTGNEGGTQTGDPSGETGSETGNEGNAQTGSESGSESGAQTGSETGSGESTSPEVPSEPDISIIEPAPTE